jgi:microcystin-dependent protein
MTPIIGEIRMVSFNFAPEYWLPCDGKEFNRYMYQNLYEAIGTTYGGNDSANTFKLPDMRGRLPMHFGQGENLSAYELGKPVGSEFITLHNAGRPEEPATYTNNPETAALTIQPSLTINFIIAYRGDKP